jgi:hypothetical protein
MLVIPASSATGYSGARAGKAAYAAWLTLTAMAHNLLCAASRLTTAHYATARAATLRRCSLWAAGDSNPEPMD